MTPKELIKLAAACRKAGIKHYKSADMEFTLKDDAPVSTYKQKKAASPYTNPVADDFESDELDDDQLLNWSVMDETK